MIGERDERLILLAPSEIRYAEADRNVVWLVTGSRPNPSRATWPG